MIITTYSSTLNLSILRITGTMKTLQVQSTIPSWTQVNSVVIRLHAKSESLTNHGQHPSAN